MQQGKWILGALLTAALGGNATAATATSASSMAECGLDFSAASAERKKLPVLSTASDGDDDFSETVTELDPASVRLFGLQASKLKYSDYEDDYEQSHFFTATLPYAYNSVRTAALKKSGAAQCMTETGAAGSRACKVFERREAGGHVQYAKLIEWSGGTRLECVYND